MRNKLLFALALVCAYFVGCADYDDSSDNHSVGPNEKEAVIDTARYTVVVYSTLEGSADSIIEDFFKKSQEFLDEKKVRVLVCHKYGIDDYDKDLGIHFTGKFAKPGDIVTFELTKDLDLKTIKKTARKAGKSVLMSDPGLLTDVLNYAADSLPAKDYVLMFYGHGGGYDPDLDYPRELRTKSSSSKLRGQVSAAILYDEASTDPETNFTDALGMFDIKREIENSSIKHLKGIFFHDCFMGNVEFLSEVYTLADYIIASEHELYADEMLMVDFVKQLHDGRENFEQTAKHFLRNTRSHWKLEYKDEGVNGDLMLLKASEMESLFPIFKKMSKRLQSFYKKSAKREQIDHASMAAYLINLYRYHFDILDFTNLVAEYTKDSVFADYAKELDEALDKLIIEKIETHNIDISGLSTFSLSYWAAYHDLYNDKSAWDYTNKEAYEYTTFHKETGWGDWLDVCAYVDYELLDGMADDEGDAEEDE